MPYSIECKNTERLNLWGALEQCKGNAPAGATPLVVFKRNRSDTYAVVPWPHLVRLRKQVRTAGPPAAPPPAAPPPAPSPAPRRDVFLASDTLVNCQKVVIQPSDTSGTELSACAATDIACGEVVESGVSRTLPAEAGDPGPAGPGVPWMSGCVALYGAAGAGAGDANTRMVRDVARRRWETVALRSIQRGEELVLA